MTDKRYWIEEIKHNKPVFVDKSDVEDTDRLFYVLHDNYAFEDYPVVVTTNHSLVIGLCDRLNEYEDILNKQDKILQENNLPMVKDRDMTFK